MANEAVCIESPTKFKRYTVDSGTALTKGTIMALSGADLYATVPLSTTPCFAAWVPFAGILWESKTATDGITEVDCAIDGVFDLKATATVGFPIGSLLCLSGTNLVRAASKLTDILSGCIVGKALETADASEVVRVRLGVI